MTPESLYGFEPGTTAQLLPGQQSYTTESVILPDTSQFLEEKMTFHNQGPLVAFPKYNNYLLDKSKFDQNTRILIPLSLLGIKPLESGEVLTKNNLPNDGAVVSYAQYKQAGSLLPRTYDDSVVRRWGVDITIGSPLISVSVLVPEYVDSTPKTTERSINFEDINVPSGKDSQNPWKKRMFEEPEVVVHENDAQYFRTGTGRTRRENNSNKKLLYKSLSGIRLPTPIRLQMWLDSNYTAFNERSNPQCVHWSTIKG